MIKVLNATKNPIQFIGQVSGVCYNSKDEPEANYKRGLKCIKDGHGRVMEYADVTLVIDGYSARVMRELYTHVIGTTKVQASTRYIAYDNFDYYVPDSVYENEEYHKAMRNILDSYQSLLDSGIKKEDAANLLPLGMTSKVVLKINYRALLHMAEVRMCERAYVEFRELMSDMILAIGNIDSEWNTLMSFMKPKCKVCTEKESCPRKKAELISLFLY